MDLKGRLYETDCIHLCAYVYLGVSGVPAIQFRCSYAAWEPGQRWICKTQLGEENIGSIELLLCIVTSSDLERQVQKSQGAFASNDCLAVGSRVSI